MQVNESSVDAIAVIPHFSTLANLESSAFEFNVSLYSYSRLRKKMSLNLSKVMHVHTTGDCLKGCYNSGKTASLRAQTAALKFFFCCGMI
jgi:hypothetical protein